MKTKITQGEFYLSANTRYDDDTKEHTVSVKQESNTMEKDYVVANTYAHSLTDAQAKGDLIADALNLSASGYDISAFEQMYKALQEVLAFEKRGADKGEPRIGNGILAIIHKAISNAKPI